MALDFYCVRLPIRGIYASGAKGFVTIPAGAKITISGYLCGHQFVKVLWNGLEACLFASDFRSRTFPIIQGRTR